MSESKRHHYLPQFYLKKFCKDKLVCVFDRKKSEYRFQQPINTAVKKHYYSLEDVPSDKIVNIEKTLSQIESVGADIISKLENREKLSLQDKKEFSLFLGFMMFRTPSFEESVNANDERMYQWAADHIFSEDSKTKSKISLEFKQLYNKEKPKIKIISRNSSLKHMVDASLHVQESFEKMDWAIFHCPETASFVTTDNPLFIAPPQASRGSVYGVGILSPGAEKIFSLSARSCLVMFEKREGSVVFHENIDKKFTKKINCCIVAHAYNFAFGRDRPLLESIIKTTKIDQTQSEFLIK